VQKRLMWRAAPPYGCLLMSLPTTGFVRVLNTRPQIINGSA